MENQFKETFEEAIDYYSENWEEINPDLDFENLTPIQVSKIDFANGALWYKNKSKEKELIEMLKEASSTIQRLKLSMLVHPAHEEGNEFDDMTSLAQEAEDSIEKLIKEANTI